MLVRLITTDPSAEVSAGSGEGELDGQRKPVAASRARDHFDLGAGQPPSGKEKTLKIRSIRIRNLKS